MVKLKFTGNDHEPPARSKHHVYFSNLTIIIILTTYRAINRVIFYLISPYLLFFFCSTKQNVKQIAQY